MNYGKWPLLGQILASIWWVFWTALMLGLIAFWLATEKAAPVVVFSVGIVGWMIFMTAPDVFHLINKWVSIDDEKLRFKRILFLVPFGGVATYLIISAITRSGVISGFVAAGIMIFWVRVYRPSKTSSEES